MKTKDPNPQPVNFRYLTAKEIQNPILLVEDFFENNHLELFRQDLRLFFTLASTDEPYMESKNYSSSGLIITHQQIIELLEAAYLLLNDKSINLKIDAESPLFQTTGNWDEHNIALALRMEHKVMKHCRLLQDREINNVRKVFKQIFKLQGLQEWREQLDILLYYSLCATPSADDCYNGQLLFPMHELLEKLLESMHIINVIKHPDQFELMASLSKESTKKAHSLPAEKAEPDHSQKPNAQHQEEDEEENNTAYTSYPEVVLSAKLQKAIVQHLETFDPKQININLRKLLFGYLNTTMGDGLIAFDADEDFQYQLSHLFKIFDLAEEETAHWPKAGCVCHFS